MESRTEYLKTIREAINFLENEDAEPNIKFGVLQSICNGLIDNIEDIYIKYSLLKDHVHEIQETLIVVAKSRN